MIFNMNLILKYFVVLAVLASAANAGSMAVSFPSQSGWTVTGTAGAPGYAQSHWVNTSGNQSSWGTQYSLVNENGQSTGAVMDWYASEIYSWQYGTAANDNERLMDAGIASVTGLVEVHVINIPYAKYKVVVYFSAQMTNAYVSKYTVGSQTVYAQIPAMGYFANDDTFKQVPSTSMTDQQGNTPTGNFIVFENVTGSTLYLTAQSSGWAGENVFTYAPGLLRASISGFQIVEVVENVNDCIGADAIVGDLNGDCKIDFADIAVIAAGWLTEGAAK
jgi:hypothetical protein